MAAQWMGYTISIDCGPMGVFQGVVTAVEAEPQSVTLSRVFHNGVPHTSPSIVISAQDIKDLTIIASPQAQLDPVVELKKPIPTRPERSFGEGAQNFHSQPAPPRALHLHAFEAEARKAGGVLDFEHRRTPTKSSAPGSQLNALQESLSNALKISGPLQAEGSVAGSNQRATAKISAAQAVSQRIPHMTTSQALLQSASNQGGFKMTTALYSNAQTMPFKGRQIPSSQSGNSKASHSPATKSSMNGIHRSVPQSMNDLPPLRSAAQVLFCNSASQLSPQGAATFSCPQGSANLASPQKTSRGFMQGFTQSSLPVYGDGYISGQGEGSRTPNRRDRQRQRWQSRDEACFGSPASNGFEEDFDFEKNLALFDKQAVYEEMAVQRPDLVQAANDHRRQQNYRHDQNILVNNRRIPAIIVPNPGSAEYVTDDGLIIPSMRPELLRQLHQKAHDVGFTFDRQTEVFARCATEMSLQLLGGAHRLNPHNAHQWPTVVVMVGPHGQGTVGVTCARQLECQGVSTVTLVVNEAAAPSLMKRELSFYKCSGGPTVSSIDELPDTVDLVIMALAGHSPSDVANSLEYGKAASWASSKRAPVLALDPPPVGTPGIIAKFALAPTLPVTYSPQNGKIYLCNLGIPIVVFKEMGIRYRSPFGSKFVIPLHPNDE